jgi:methyl coenzyme M reductase beta subunit
MRDQVWYVALLIAIMCLVRFGLSAIGYVYPHWLMEQLGAPIAANLQMPYTIRVWAIRDIVLAILVAFSNKNSIQSLLFACIAIDISDVVSAHISGATGLFDATHTLSLKLTAIAALIPESAALALMVYRKPQAE